MKQKRINILKQIDLLESKRCSKCTGTSAVNNSLCECPAAIKVRRLGKLLNGLVKPRKDHKTNVLEKKTGLSDFTVEEYEKLKRMNITDKDVFRSRRVSSSSFIRWKRENGVATKKYRESVKQ